MSNFFPSTATLWKPGTRDPLTGLTSYGQPVVVKVNYQLGGNTELTDSTGTLFRPVAQFWTDLSVVNGSLDGLPGVGWQIAQGDHRGVSDPSTIDARQIRGETVYDNSPFNEPSDYMFAT